MNKLVYLIAITLLISCGSNKEYEELDGVWYSCSEDNLYTEFIIKDGKYRYSNTWETVTPWCRFEVSEDTLIQYSKIEHVDDSIYKSLMTLKKDKMKLIFLDSETSEIWHFSKYPKEVILPNSDELLNNETVERSKELNCIDFSEPEVDFEF